MGKTSKSSSRRSKKALLADLGDADPMRETIDTINRIFDGYDAALLAVDTRVLTLTDRVRDLIARTDRILANDLDEDAPGTGSDSSPSSPPAGNRSCPL
jgi:hypothetical protein